MVSTRSTLSASMPEQSKAAAPPNGLSSALFVCCASLLLMYMHALKQLLPFFPSTPHVRQLDFSCMKQAESASERGAKNDSCHQVHYLAQLAPKKCPEQNANNRTKKKNKPRRRRRRVSIPRPLGSKPNALPAELLLPIKTTRVPGVHIVCGRAPFFRTLIRGRSMSGAKKAGAMLECGCTGTFADVGRFW